MRRLALVFLVFFAPHLAFAQSVEERRVLDLVGFAEIVEIMRLEGLADGQSIPQDIMGYEGSSNWDAELQRIYDTESLLAELETSFVEAFDWRFAEESIAFLETPAWQDALSLEVSARKAMLEPGVEEAVLAGAWDEAGRNSARGRLTRRLMAEAEFVEKNVEGSMRSMLAFYLGLMDGGFDLGISEGDLYSMILSEEDALYDDIDEWLFAVLLMAYDPLEKEQIEEQIEFWQTEAGAALNDAMFEAFDAMFVDLSFQLGVSAAKLLQERVL